MLANSGDTDQTPLSVATDLGLHCLFMSHKKDARLLWVIWSYFLYKHWRSQNAFSYINKSLYFYCPFQGGTSFVEKLWYFCLVRVMLSRLFIAALWSPAGKGLTSWLSFVVLNCVLLVSHVVSWVRYGT